MAKPLGTRKLLHELLRNRMLRGSAATVALKLATIAFMMLGNVWVARSLSAAHAGNYLMVFNGVYFIALVGQLGLRTAAIRWVADSIATGRADQTRSAVVVTLQIAHLSFMIASCLAAAGLYLASAFDHTIDLTITQVLAISIWIITLGVQYILPEVFRAEQRYVLAGLTSGALTNGLVLLGFFICDRLFSTASLTAAFSTMAFSGIVNYCVIMTYALRMLSELPRGHFRSISVSVNESLPILGTQICTGAISLLDVIIVGSIVGATPAALYGIVSRMTVLINLPLQICGSVLSPQIASGFARQDTASVQKLAQIGATISAVPGLLIAALFFMFGKDLLALFGPDYQPAYGLLILLTFGQVALLLAGPTTHLLMLCGQQAATMRLVGRIAIVSCIFQCVGGALLGVYGVAVTVALTHLLLSVAQNYAARRWVGVACNVRLHDRLFMQHEESKL